MNLRPYQEVAADFLFERDRAMILAPVGAGKTAITLTAMQDMTARGLVRRWLVLAPKRVAQSGDTGAVCGGCGSGREGASDRRRCEDRRRRYSGGKE